MNIIKLKGNCPEDFEALLKNRGQALSGDLLTSVSHIIERVQREGDKAIAELTYLYDGIRLGAEDFKVTQAEIEESYKKVSDRFLKALGEAKDNIYNFHRKQMEASWFIKKDGVFLGQMVNPIDSVGIYVPGGSASYPSSVLMNSIPAKVAGVKRLVMITPPGTESAGVSPEVLVAASEAGVDEVYRIGGAQGIAALAYGTDTIPAVDKITGPGNVYVALAKRLVFGTVGIDMIAGPSEVLIIADKDANPAFVAADMLAQAEHDTMACCTIITDSEILLKDVEAELNRQIRELSRRDIAKQALESYGALILVGDIEEACRLCNRIAPEHLGLMVREPMVLLGKIKNAGAVFLGDYSPEALGDYIAGPNHVLPTGGTARFASPLGVEQFIKRTNVAYYSAEALRKVTDNIIVLAETEGLTAHSQGVELRCVNEKSDN